MNALEGLILGSKENNIMARPTQFDRGDVLEKAMLTFWEHGFGATSIANLVEATELKPGSLYAAFDSKQSLFLAALEHYTDQRLESIRRILEEADSPLQGIRDYFNMLARYAGGAHAGRGCLLVNTILELSRQDTAVKGRVNAHLDRIEALFRVALEEAQQCGELPADRDPEQLAAFIMINIWGIRVLDKTASAPERTQATVDLLLGVLDS